MERCRSITQSACTARHLRVSEFYGVQDISVCCVCKPNLLKLWYLRIQAREAEFQLFVFIIQIDIKFSNLIQRSIIQTNCLSEHPPPPPQVAISPDSQLPTVPSDLKSKTNTNKFKRLLLISYGKEYIIV